ncbi:hypothetical protein [Aliivibrio salmonicida]|uniref:hypothetical protein n=1 Tax=Aliivibrio salmonicida TaxID=40269 RepID=UPI003D0DDC83
MNKITVLILLSLALVGCNDSDDELSPKDKIAGLEVTGELPTLDRSDDIAGPDINNNGIRDDIEKYIEITYQEPKQRTAAMQMAKALQMNMVIDVTNKDRNKVKADIRKMDVAVGEALNCLNDQFSGPDAKNTSIVWSEIKSMMTNTKKRLLAYLSVSKAANGMVFSLQDGSCNKREYTTY